MRLYVKLSHTFSMDNSGTQTYLHDNMFLPAQNLWNEHMLTGLFLVGLTQVNPN